MVRQYLGGAAGYKSVAKQHGVESLRHQFKAEAANQKSVADVTGFNVTSEKQYLSTILDLYNGDIIAFETSKRPVVDIVSSMLKTALAATA